MLFPGNLPRVVPRPQGSSYCVVQVTELPHQARCPFLHPGNREWEFMEVHVDVSCRGVALVDKSRGDGRIFMSPYVLHKQYDCRIGVFFIENCPSGCWEPGGAVGAMALRRCLSNRAMGWPC